MEQIAEVKTIIDGNTDFTKITIDDMIDYLNTKTKEDRQWFRELVSKEYVMQRQVGDTTKEIMTTTPYAIIRQEFIKRFFPDKVKPKRKSSMIAKLAMLKD
jgi:hypothetical protein